MSSRKAFESAQQFHNEWEIPNMCLAPCKAPADFCMGCFCCCCQVWMHRSELLGHDWSKYVLCGGLWGEDRCTSCTRPCPRCCMFMEVCCCTSCAMHGNRWMIQQRYQLRNTPCDLCIMYTLCICSWVNCILNILGQGCDELDTAVDLFYWTVMGCMNTQHEQELKKRRGAPGLTPPPVQTMQGAYYGEPAQGEYYAQGPAQGEYYAQGPAQGAYYAPGPPPAQGKF